jgi:hypothetical protein
MQHGVALLVVVGHAPYPELAQAFISTQPRILSFLQRHKSPYIAKIYRPSPGDIANDPSAVGRIELWYPKTAAKTALKPDAAGKLRGS